MKGLEEVRRLLGRTPKGRELLEEAVAVDARAGDRAVARSRWDAAEARKADLPTLQEAVQAAAKAYDEGLARLAGEVATARSELDQAVQSIDREQAAAETVLRPSADPLIREHGPLLSWLWDARLHVRRHIGINADQNRERLRDCVEPDFRPGAAAAKADLKERVRLADWGEEALPAFDDAIEAVRNLQLEVDPDPNAAVAEILGTLPTTCACGQKFDFEAGAPNEPVTHGTPHRSIY